MTLIGWSTANVKRRLFLLVEQPLPPPSPRVVVKAKGIVDFGGKLAGSSSCCFLGK